MIFSVLFSPFPPRFFKILLIALCTVVGLNSCSEIGSTQKAYSLQYKVFTTSVGTQPTFSVSLKNKQQTELLIGPITSNFWLSDLFEDVNDGFLAALKVQRIQNDEIPLTLEIIRDGAVHASIDLRSYEQEIELQKEL